MNTYFWIILLFIFFLIFLAFLCFYVFSAKFFPKLKKRFRRKLVCVQIRSVGLSSNPFSRDMSVIFQECRFFPF